MKKVSALFIMMLLAFQFALPGIGHACGHNLIAVGSLGAALATKAWLEEDPSRKGTVKLFGTPVPP